MTIPKDCKRLAEVDFPLQIVGMHSLAEKKVFISHPQGFHQWWARRPLAACRSMLLGLLLPDPSDENCPRDIISGMRDILGVLYNIGKTNDELREILIKFIGEFSSYELSTNRQYLEVSRKLIELVHGSDLPLVVDPFSGGGSIPLEALRLGCDVFASDLNPIPVLILKTMLDALPRKGNQILEDFSNVANKLHKDVVNEFETYYPQDEDGAEPIAYIWARTVKCESPNCGGEIPLIRSMWLSKKASRKKALRVRSVRVPDSIPSLQFEIFEPNNDSSVQDPIVSQAKATCPHCHKTLSAERVRAQLSEQKGGGKVLFDSKGARIGGATGIAVVRQYPGKQGRGYRVFAERDYQPVWQSQLRLDELEKKNKNLLPNETINPTRPSPNARGLSAVTRYGMSQFRHLFSVRQLLLFATIIKLIEESEADEDVKILTSFILSRLVDRQSELVGWDPGGETTDHVFKRQALPMRWDFAEGVPIVDTSGSISNIIVQLKSAAQSCLNISQKTATVQIADACSHPLPDQSATVWFTDPPYYDSVPYADLSDYFYVWLKQSLPRSKFIQDPFDSQNTLTPKVQECVWNSGYIVEGKPKNSVFFENSMARAFSEGKRVLKENEVACVVFAHKTTEGWEALLSGIIRGGFIITASWPIMTERSGRKNAQDTASLGSSVHLICRPRSDNAPIGDWSQVSRELPRKVGDWMERLQKEGVRGADLVFACIGPALEIYSRYAKVVDAQDREIPLGGDPTAGEPYQRGYLAYVWEVVGRLALEQVLGSAEAQARNGNAGALEEDSRLTALFLWTMQSAGNGNGKIAKKGKTEEPEEDEDEDKPRKSKPGYKLIYDVARRFAQPLGIHLEQWEGRIIETEKGIVRLMPVAERARQLFGEEGAQAVVETLARDPSRPVQMSLFPELESAPRLKTPRRAKTLKVSETFRVSRREPTTLDRLHAAMLLQKGGQSNALRTMLKSEMERSPDFLRLANALSALYPRESEEKRLLDAMLQAIPR